MAILPHTNSFVKGLKTMKLKKKTLKRVGKSAFWFALGGILGLFFFVSFLYIFYQKSHTGRVYDGVVINGIDFGGKTQDEVRSYFAQQNKNVAQTTFTLTSPQITATLSAQDIGFGYDADLMAQQAMSVGRSADTLSNMSLIVQAYTQNVMLPPAYHFQQDKINKKIVLLKSAIDIQPVDPLFDFQNGHVTAFRLGTEGMIVDNDVLQASLLGKLQDVLRSGKPEALTMVIPTKSIPSAVAQDKANQLGIKEVVGEGTSLFEHSIDNRIYNISLAATRLNGTIIKPGEVFSFNKAVGDISVFSGYKQAYVIDNGKTVMGDGGGVCQVSTTLFRAALAAGLPIVERNPHAYRVGYYEQNSGPGIDAAIYSPSVDLKFKNDTKNNLLIQSYVDLDTEKLTFDLYGTKDGRQVAIGNPVITSQTPAPPPVYQDDPTLPKGQVKQVDFAADGANVYFTRTVKKDGKVVIADKFVSNYKPWQAIYMRGTQ